MEEPIKIRAEELNEGLTTAALAGVGERPEVRSVVQRDVPPVAASAVGADRTHVNACTNMKFNRGDYVILTEGAAQEVGVVWGIHPTEIASLEVYWLGGGNRWSKYYEPKNLILVQPTELPDYAIELRGSLGL